MIEQLKAHILACVEEASALREMADRARHEDAEMELDTMFYQGQEQAARSILATIEKMEDAAARRAAGAGEE